MTDKPATTEKTTPSGEATTGNVGLSADVYADDRKVEEAATKTQEQWDEFHKVPDEALTPEAREAIEHGEEVAAEEEQARQDRVEAAEHPTGDTGGPTEINRRAARSQPQRQGQTKESGRDD